MDDRNFKKILENIETPSIDENAKKRAMNLASAAFDAQQKEKAQEKQNKFQGSSLLTRLMGNSKTKTHKKERNLMEKKTRKNFIYGGMATAMALIIVASVSFDHYPDFGADKGAEQQASISSLLQEDKNIGKSLTDKYRNALETRNHPDFESTEEDTDSFVPPVTQAPLEKKMTKSNNRQPYGSRQRNESGQEQSVSRAVPSKKKDAVKSEAVSPYGLKPQGNVMAYTGSSSLQDQKSLRTSIAPMSKPVSPSIVIAQDEIAPDYYKETGRDKFEDFKENPIKSVKAEPVSTFSIDVDTASYSFIRRQLNAGVLPQKDAVRLEEMINYFDYDYPVAEDLSKPFKTTVTIIDSPWAEGKKLMHIGIKGYDIVGDKPKSNIVFLLDVSGSMSSPDKLPLVKNSMKMLLDSLNPDDTVAIAVYAGAAGTVLEPTPVSDKAKIFAAFDRLKAGGSTAGAAGINLAYQLAEQNFDENAVNRVILATDGDFNVGINNHDELKDFVERKREKGVFLSALGFGQGNYNDDLMQTLAQNGNGTAAYIDTLNEARKVLVDEASSSLFPIAKDVKIQVEFNPAEVSEYRLVGYETRALKREDFNNDKVDAGDIGAGHTVTAIYEITPVGATPSVDPLRYDTLYDTDPGVIMENKAVQQGHAEIAFLKLRYKLPGSNKSILMERPITQGDDLTFCPANAKCDRAATPNYATFSTAVAGFGLILKGGQYSGSYSYDDVINDANASKGPDLFGYRAEFIQMVRLAKSASAMRP